MLSLIAVPSAAQQAVREALRLAMCRAAEADTCPRERGVSALAHAGTLAGG